MKAIDAVENLRKLADLLEKHGDLNISMVAATVWAEQRDSFLELARAMPRPFRKEVDEEPFSYLMLKHGELSKSGMVELRIRRSTACRLIEPAKPARYDCDPILSADEEAQLEKA